MTSEGPHHPGQEPDEVSPGTGAPAPYGVANPDLGWAPPPPAARPNPPAPAWATQHDQPPTAAWGAAPVTQHDQPPTVAWGAASPGEQPPTVAWAVPSPGEQPPTVAWAVPSPGEQPPTTAWGAAQVPAAQPAQPATWGPQPGGAAQPEQPAPAWAPDDQGGPAWAAAVPPAPPPTGGGSAAGVPSTGAPAASGGQPVWAPQPEQSAPAWAGPADQAPPAWDQTGGSARGAARVPVSAPPPPSERDASADANHSGGWNPTSPHGDPAGSGGWAAQAQPQPGLGAATEQVPPAWGQADAEARGTARVPAPTGPSPADPAPSAGWMAGGHDAQPDGSGGWAAGQRDDPQASGSPEAGESGTPARGAASVPQPDARPETPGWASAEPTPAPPTRATATVGVDGPPAWGGSAQSPQPWSADRPAVPDVQPWGPGEAWGRTEAEPAAPQQGGGREPERSENPPPLYQPAPAPGFSPANVVPLPPQEQRVPGASLAAAPPADYVPGAPFGEPSAAEPSSRTGAYESEPTAVDAGWGNAEQPQSPAGPLVPGPRVSMEAGASARAAVPTPGATDSPAGGSGSISASASVPLASRATPSADQPLHPGGTPVPQPRVYGRPARPEPTDGPEQAQEQGFHGDHNPPPPRYDEPGQHGFGDAGPQQHAGPGIAPPAFPPGVPTFVDPPSNTRPVNGVRPHPGEHSGEQFGGPGAPGGTAGMGSAPAPNPYGEPETTPFSPAQPPAGPQQGTPPWGTGSEQGNPPWAAGPEQGGTSWGDDPEQSRFEAFKPEAAEPKTEAPAPTPKIRNGRVLAAVLVAAVLILAVPLGLLLLLGKIGSNGDDKAVGFNPAVGSCVKQSGGTATAATCGETGSFTVVSRVDNKDKCADPAQPHVVLPGSGADRVLCLKPATK